MSDVRSTTTKPLWRTNTNLNIKDRYYTNALENNALDNKHKLQKKKIFEAGIHKEIVAVSKQLHDCAMSTVVKESVLSETSVDIV